MKLKGVRFSAKLWVGIILALCFVIALYFRIYLPYDQVFSGDGIKFTGVDAYYHMRLVDSLVSHFPYRIIFDPYTSYPSGATVGWPPFFGWLLGGIIWVISFGSPTPHLVDVVGVYFPAVLGALTIIPVFLIGRVLFNRWVGVISAGLVAILPGEFMGRSILGFTDHHVAETLFSTVAMLFLIMAIKTARERQLSFHHLRRRDWPVAVRPLVYSLGAGIFLGIYLLTWMGALLFVLVISAYLVVQFIIDHLRHRSTDYLCLVGAIPFFVALLMLLPISPEILYPISLVIALLTPPVLSGLSYLLGRRWQLRPWYYPLTLAGLGLAGLAFFLVINLALVKSVLALLASFFVPNITTIILEKQSILFPGGEFSLLAIWGNFTTSFFLGLIALGILIYFAVKQGNPERSLLVVWSLVILAATLGQVRFAYYLVVNVALLTGYLSWRLLELAGFREMMTEPMAMSRKVAREKARREKRREGGFHITPRQLKMSLGIIAILLFVFAPNIGGAVATAKQARFAPSDSWVSSLVWLKENTPDPFGDPGFYYQVYPPPPPGVEYEYPATAYGVMAWWDYGHWITRISHRLPNATPADWGSAALFFTVQGEAAANSIMDELNIKYVVANYDTATIKFHAVITVAGRSTGEFFDTYYLPESGSRVRLFFPEYYRSLFIRLYNFDGKAVTPKSTGVISYQEKVGRDGVPYKEITWAQVFSSYAEAADYVARRPSGKYRVVGTGPFISPVPLAGLEHYRLVYSSANAILEGSIGMIPEIKIFEYVK